MWARSGTASREQADGPSSRYRHVYTHHLHRRRFSQTIHTHTATHTTRSPRDLCNAHVQPRLYTRDAQCTRRRGNTVASASSESSLDFLRRTSCYRSTNDDYFLRVSMLSCTIIERFISTRSLKIGDEIWPSLLLLRNVYTRTYQGRSIFVFNRTLVSRRDLQTAIRKLDILSRTHLFPESTLYTLLWNRRTKVRCRLYTRKIQL